PSQPVWIGTLPMTTTFQWERCTGNGVGCIAIPGANEAAYTATDADVADFLTVVQTATNAGGTRSITLAPTNPVRPALPVNSILPTLDGTTQSGQALVVTSNGVWSGSPTGFAYQWRRCDGPDGNEGGSCSDVPGATAATYVLTGADVGSELRVSVTAA